MRRSWSLIVFEVDVPPHELDPVLCRLPYGTCRGDSDEKGKNEVLAGSFLHQGLSQDPLSLLWPVWQLAGEPVTASWVYRTWRSRAHTSGIIVIMVQAEGPKASGLSLTYQ